MNWTSLRRQAASICGLLLMLAVLFHTVEFSAFAEKIILEASEEEILGAQELPESNEELLKGYAEQKLNAGKPHGLLMAPKNNASKLNEINKAVYWALRDKISAVAAGELQSTVFTVSVKALGLSQTSWTAGELGMPILVGENTINPEAKNAVNSILGLDLALVVKTLLTDCPYELYWYDKTANTTWNRYSWSATNSTLSITGDMVFRFPVAEEYAIAQYMVDSSYGLSIHTAVQNAQDIVTRYAPEADYDKLNGYRVEICDLTSYNYAAAYEHAAYGNPWQLIWVFDGRPDTKVVCEGYAKAFQYLCDLSSFNDNITAYTVNGSLGSVAHMWNLVTMEDGLNYLVDLTNCDSGTAGAPDYLFLAGYESGSVQEGYVCTGSSSSLTYTYSDDAFAVYSDEELTLADQAYHNDGGGGDGTCPNGHKYQFSEWSWASDVLSAEAIFRCSRNQNHVMRISVTAVKKEGIPAAGGIRYEVKLNSNASPDGMEHNASNVKKTTGWLQAADGNWYFLNAQSELCTGWLQDNGKWYYLNGSGVMQRGWLQDNRKWYYFDGSGAMQTGWVKDNGTWYYFDSSGAMKTGWLQDNGKWYYFNGSGTMQTGWVKDSGTWYYFDGSGAMKTGWLQDNGKWYYFDGSGAMKTGWLQDNGKWYYFNGSGAMQTGWLKLAEKWYYFENSGVMVTGKRNISGKEYMFDSSGMCTNP